MLDICLCDLTLTVIKCTSKWWLNTQYFVQCMILIKYWEEISMVELSVIVALVCSVAVVLSRQPGVDNFSFSFNKTYWHLLFLRQQVSLSLAMSESFYDIWYMIKCVMRSIYFQHIAKMMKQKLSLNFQTPYARVSEL